MEDHYSIWKKRTCDICNGKKVIIVKNNHTKPEYVPCDHCNGKGFLKLLKSDYDY